MVIQTYVNLWNASKRQEDAYSLGNPQLLRNGTFNLNSTTIVRFTPASFNPGGISSTSGLDLDSLLGFNRENSPSSLYVLPTHISGVRLLRDSIQKRQIPVMLKILNSQQFQDIILNLGDVPKDTLNETLTDAYWTIEREQFLKEAKHLAHEIAIFYEVLHLI